MNILSVNLSSNLNLWSQNASLAAETLTHVWDNMPKSLLQFPASLRTAAAKTPRRVALLPITSNHETISAELGLSN